MAFKRVGAYDPDIFRSTKNGVPNRTTTKCWDDLVPATIAAERLGVTRQAIYARIRRGSLACVRVGWAVFIPQYEITRLQVDVEYFIGPDVAFSNGKS